MKKKLFIKLKRAYNFRHEFIHLNINKQYKFINDRVILFGTTTIQGSWKEYKNRSGFKITVKGTQEEIQKLIETTLFNNSFEDHLK